VTGRAAVVFD